MSLTAPTGPVTGPYLPGSPITGPLIESDFIATTPDRHVWAQSLVEGAARLNKTAPKNVDLAAAITQISPESHIKGASQITITIVDPGWNLLTSGFFSPSGAVLTPGERNIGPKMRRIRGGPRRIETIGGNLAQLDPLDVNYPTGSIFWWRLTQVSPSSTGSGQGNQTIKLVFTDRLAAILMSSYGPYKANRAAMTRAEFLKYVTLKAVPWAKFYSYQLDVKQKIDPALSQQPKNSNYLTGSNSKTPGIGANTDNLTVKGVPASPAQIAVGNQLIAVANKEGANEYATAAMFYAAIWESGMSPNSNNGRFWGVLSGSVNSFAQSDTVGMATCFLRGGKGFHPDPGGAIALSTKGVNGQGPPVTNIAEIAVMVEGSSLWPNNIYATEAGYPGDTIAFDEAKAWVKAGGGTSAASTGSVEESLPFYFTIGTSEQPHEDDFTGMTRLANQVNWELFTVGDAVYYDSEQTLIRQKVAAVIDINDPRVQDWSYDWETRQIATSMTLHLICDPFEFRAGDVFLLTNWGPASDGSSAKPPLPGRWLVSDVTRQDTNTLTAQFTLVQPDMPKDEPANATQSVSVGGAGVTADINKYLPGSVERAYAAAQVLDSYKRPYSQATRQLTVPPPGPYAPNGPSPQAQGMDCSSSTCWVLWQAGMYNGPTSWAEVSGQLAQSWGQPGPGKQMTVWANSEHVFIEFNLQGGPHVQMNTVNPGSLGPRLEPWSYSNSYAGDGAKGWFTPRHWPGT